MVQTSTISLFLSSLLYFAIWQEDIFKNVISHAKEYGFIFPSSEIYLSAVYAHKRSRIKRTYENIGGNQWFKCIIGLDASILMHPTTWKASGMLTL
jgi:glycyl-tRNA synthetase